MPTDAPSVLLAYFSRPGEHYHGSEPVDQPVGNTELLAGMIAQRLGCQLHRIRPAQPYPASYDETVQRNLAEQEIEARPEIAGPAPDVSGVDVVILASPIWNERPPLIMRTFAESLDLADKLVLAVTTHAFSRLGTTEHEYALACRGALIGEGLAVRDQDVEQAGELVEAWLARTGIAEG